MSSKRASRTRRAPGGERRGGGRPRRLFEPASDGGRDLEQMFCVEGGRLRGVSAWIRFENEEADEETGGKTGGRRGLQLELDDYTHLRRLSDRRAAWRRGEKLRPRAGSPSGASAISAHSASGTSSGRRRRPAACLGRFLVQKLSMLSQILFMLCLILVSSQQLPKCEAATSAADAQLQHQQASQEAELAAAAVKTAISHQPSRSPQADSESPLGKEVGPREARRGRQSPTGRLEQTRPEQTGELTNVSYENAPTCAAPV